MRSIGLRRLFLLLLFLLLVIFGWSAIVAETYDVSCDFNSICHCWLREDVDFAKMDINCMAVTFVRFPDVLISSVAQLDIVGSGIQILDNDALASSSTVEALGLVSNKLMSITDKSLAGVSDSLRSLDLSYNSLEEIPFAAVQGLRKLNWLNMHSNHITTLEGEWGYVKNTLTNAFFGENSITEVPRCFSDFDWLVTLNMDTNNIQDLDASLLPPNIHTLSLNHNLLKSFPFSVGRLRNLRSLSFRGNDITRVKLPVFSSSSLELFDLSENYIESIDFAGYSTNRSLHIWDLNLSNNKLTFLSADVFKYLEVTRIHLSSNGIRSIHDDTFRGMDETLEYLNLENNLLPTIPRAVNRMRRISYLYLANNEIRSLTNDSFLSFADNLKALSLATNGLEEVPVNALAKCTNLLHLNLGYNKISQIEPGEFDWAENLEILLLRNNLLSNLKANIFRGASQLKELSLSFNYLVEIDDDAFVGVEESLEILELSFAFSSDIFPQRALRPLVNILWLVLDNNNFHTIEATAFYSFPHLRFINLESNRLRFIPERLFFSRVHSDLRDIKMGYNFIEAIPENTFYNLTVLRSLDFTGNRIKALSARTIEECPNLVTLSLAYNRISSIDREAFSGLYSLRFLHLEFNRLTELDLYVFSDSGASDFALNVSYNSITTLEPGFSVINLTRLDLGHNNISHLPADVFLNAQKLRSIDLRGNRLLTIEPGTFTLDRLEILSLRDNRLEFFRTQSFNGLSSLQQLDLGGNAITQFAMDQFKHLRKLRILNVTGNKLRSLQRDIFASTRIEMLDLSNNRFTVVPASSFLEISYTLRHLNLAGNLIDHLDSSSFPISQLTSLDLARNRLTILPDNSFVSLSKLLSLDVSHNYIRANFKELFHYLPDLKYLSLASCGLKKIPTLLLSSLKSLDLSFNGIDTMSNHDFHYFADLRVLLLAKNSLSSIAGVRLNQLRKLDISANPIEALTKDSFSGFPRLETLNLTNLYKVKTVDKNSFKYLRYLKNLQIQTWPNMPGFHLRPMLNELPLRNVEIQVLGNELSNQLQNAFTRHLRELTITGHQLEYISADAFSTIEGGELTLRIRGTRIRRFLPNIFRSLTKHLSQLTLDLRNNLIHVLSPSVIYGNQSWETVGTNLVSGGMQLSGNPLECDCEIAWLSLWLRRWLRESRQIHTASQSDARQLRSIAGRAVCTETTSPFSGDKVLLDLGTPHTACQASALSSANSRRFASFVEVLLLIVAAAA